METFIRDWADKKAVVIEAITETFEEVSIYVPFVHIDDLMCLDKIIRMEKNFHVSFVNAISEDLIEIQLFKN